MENSTEFRCEIGTTHPESKLGLEIWLDNKKFFDCEHVTQAQTVCHFVTEENDDESEHVLRFVMKNKTDVDTKLDESGNIVENPMIWVKDFKFDDIEVSQLMFDNSEYTHDYNGTGSTVSQKFYGNMGCNGTVTMKFASPVYLWLLEMM